MEPLLFHPRMVHLPIGLGLIMPLAALGLLLAWWRGWLPRRAWLLAVALQALLFGSALLAERTGHREEEAVEKVVPERFIHAHEEAGEAFVVGSGVVLGLMLLALALSSRRAGLPLAAASAIGTFIVLGLGYRAGEAGGALVYEHGAARAYTGDRCESPSLPGSSGSPREAGER